MAYIKGCPFSDCTSGEKSVSQRGIAEIIHKVALGLHEAHLSEIVLASVPPV